MEFRVLGELHVGGPDEDRTPRGQRSRDLLAVLLLRRAQSVDPGVLLDLVWGNEAPALQSAVVHTQLARLRRVLGGDQIETTDRGYRLNDAHTDADRFVELLARARAGTQPAETIAMLREALALWRADTAYADVTADLVCAETIRLHEVRLGALELLTERLLSIAIDGSTEEALELTQELRDREPLRERGYELAMLALWRAGRQVDALAVYDHLQRTLRDEIGVDPGASARQLHARVLAQDATLSTAPARPVRALRQTPPAPTTRIVGRVDDLAKVMEMLDERRLVVITGPGGVGKSRALSEIHQRVQPARDVAFLDLAVAGAVDLEELVEALGQALGLTLDPTNPLESLVASLADADLVLLVDEAERSGEAVAVAAATLVRRCSRLQIVVASRRPLGVVGEADHELGPLGCPAPEAGVHEVARSPAVTLLQDRLADHAPGLVLTEPDLFTLARFARRVDGLPLALELLAGYANTRSLEELTDMIDTPLELSSDALGRPERHRSLRDTILWSAERLPVEHRRVLRRLGIFMGSFDPHAARAVVGFDCGDVDGISRALVREALVHVERTPQGVNLRLLRTVRDLALSELAEHDELRGARARHRRWHAGRWRGALRSDALLFDVRDHYTDYLSALRSGTEDGDADTIGDLTLTLGRLWTYTDMLGPGLRWSGRALDSGLLSRLHVAQVRTMRATLSLHHDPSAVRADLAMAVPVLVEEGEAIWLTTAYLTAAMERAESGDDDEAVVQGRLAVAASRATTEERQADALGVLASAAADTDPVEAEAAAREAWVLVTRSGSATAVASVASNLAWALFKLGRPDAGAELVERAASLQDSSAVPTFLRLDLAWAALLRHDLDQARKGFARVIAANPDALEDRKSAAVYLGAACALAGSGDPVAPELLAGAEALVERTGLVLTPWQVDLLNEARARIADLPPAPWGSEHAVVGRRLSELVRQGDGPGPT